MVIRSTPTQSSPAAGGTEAAPADKNWSLAWGEQPAPDHVDGNELTFQRLKVDIHQELIDSLDLSRAGRLSSEQLQSHMHRLVSDECAARIDQLDGDQRDRLGPELMDELFGVGPLEPLMGDEEITDILVNDAYTVYVEREGRLHATNVVFADDQHLIRIIQRIVSRLGRRIDEVSPLVDARLPDGSRINAVIPPLALDGPCLSIRRFGTRPLRMRDLIENGSVPEVVGDFLRAIVVLRLGTVISGGTGAGKTTLLNAMSVYIPEDERIVTIEDSAELILQHRHRVRLETRPPNMEGVGELTQRDLVRNSLRMRPDRILVGEVRGPEAWDMLQAMNTGHEGSLTTVHANSSSDALARLEMMIAMTGFELPVEVVRNYIATGIKVIVHVTRLKGGPRRLMQVSEIVADAERGYVVKEIFVFEQEGVDEDGVAYGKFRATGYTPSFLQLAKSHGVEMPASMFEPRDL